MLTHFNKNLDKLKQNSRLNEIIENKPILLYNTIYGIH